MHYNPLYDVAKADAHTPKDVAALFVRDASPIWRDLQYPINHLVVGARTGKTMAPAPTRLSRRRSRHALCW